MLELGTKIQYGEQLGKVVARTFERQPKYDLLFSDGRIRQYIPEDELKVVERPKN